MTLDGFQRTGSGRERVLPPSGSGHVGRSSVAAPVPGHPLRWKARRERLVVRSNAGDAINEAAPSFPSGPCHGSLTSWVVCSCSNFPLYAVGQTTTRLADSDAAKALSVAEDLGGFLAHDNLEGRRRGNSWGRVLPGGYQSMAALTAIGCGKPGLEITVTNSEGSAQNNPPVIPHCSNGKPVHF